MATTAPQEAAKEVSQDNALLQRAKAVGLRIYKPQMGDYKHKILLYGDPGAGKTTLAATACNVPEMQDTLIVNIEGGIMSVIEAGEVGIDHTPDVIDLDKWPDLEDIFLFLQNEEHKYKTLIIDSVSELNKLNLDYVVGKAVARNNKRSSTDDVWLEDHGASSKQMRRVIRAFRDLDMHVILTCHAASQQDKDREEQVFPSLPPKLRESVAGFMDVVGFLYTEEVEVPIPNTNDTQTRLERRMLTQPYRKWMAKDRSPGGRLGMVVKNPTMPLIYDRIAGRSTEENDEGEL